MSKLNKQEKDYMVGRIKSEIANASGAFPAKSLFMPQAIRDSVENGTLKLKTKAEIVKEIKQVVCESSYYGSLTINISDIIEVPKELVKSEAKFDAAKEVWAAKRLELDLKAQPLLDAINLGEAAAEDLSKFIASIKGSV